MAEQRLKNEGLLGFFGKAKASGTPEGAVVAIVETFWRSFIQKTLANPAVTRTADEPAKQLKLQQFKREVLAQIEQHRKRFYGGSLDYPQELTDYVHYRIDTEVRHMHRFSPEQMGIDREAISHMVNECNSFFRARIDELR